MDEQRDTIFNWLQRAANAKYWLDFYEGAGVDKSLEIVQRHQRDYDAAMAKVRQVPSVEAEPEK